MGYQQKKNRRITIGLFVSGIPFLLIASVAEGYTSIMYDNKSGTREGLEYMIKKAGCRKFGFIGAASGNTDAHEREEVFLDVMKEHNIPIEPKQMVYGNCAKLYNSAFSQLLDNNPDLDAVFCMNDDTALGLYDELNKRGLQIGKDICVLGYDDIAAAEKLSPSLSTVRADSYFLGEEAVKMAIRAVNGEKLENCILPAKFILRDSIKSKHREQMASPTDFLSECPIAFNNIFHYVYSNQKEKEHFKNIYNTFMELFELLYSIGGSRHTDTTAYDEAITLLERFLRQDALKYADVSQFLSFLERSYRTFDKNQQSFDGKYQLRDFYSRLYRKIIKNMNNTQNRMIEENVQTNFSMRAFSQNIMFFEKGIDQSYSYVLNNLDWLHITTGFLYLLKKPVYHLMREPFETPDEMYLKAVRINNEVRIVPASQQKVSIAHIFDHNLIPQKEAFRYVLLPLYSNNTVYGFLLSDLPPEQYEQAEFLANQMGATVKMISLLNANEQIQTKLEESLLQLKQNNIELDNLSKSDTLTGIFNRRGFYSKATELFKSENHTNKYLYVMYADMNNLKIINDRYGHDEGDFSLNKIAVILSEYAKQNGIAARIGGDEFAMIQFLDEPNKGQEIITRITSYFDEFNRTSDKLYNLQISIGCYETIYPTTLSLDEMLEIADQKLYEAKKYRKKEVDKSITT